MADSYLCRECSKIVTATRNNRYRTHDKTKGVRCEMASAEIPPDLLAQGPVDPKAPREVPVAGQDYAECPLCDRNVKLTRLGYFEPHPTTMNGGDRCRKSGTRLHYPPKVGMKPTRDVPLPGDSLPAKGLYRAQSAAVTDTDIGKKLTDASGHVKDDKPPTGSELVPVTGTPAPAAALVTGGAVPAAPAAPTPSVKADASVTTSEAAPTSSSPSPVPGTPPSESGSPDTSKESTSTSKPSPKPGTDPSVRGPFSLGTTYSAAFRQPDSPFLQPPEWTGSPKPEPMGGLAKELSTKIKETFYSYSNRKSADNRSAQTTLGPSEIGTPCDRRLAMALMAIPAVNPGGDGWAAFVGTCTHVGMANIYTFADAGTGRYAVEMPVFLGMPSVPRGTTDLLDRRDGTVIDWKVMGAYSLKKFKEVGPSETYRTQAQVYGLGAERAGEAVRNVAIVGLPRAGSSLDEMHVWTAKYDRKFAQAALDRVERIASEVKRLSEPMHPDGDWSKGRPMEVAREFPAGDDCRYCPFYLKGDKEMKRGCPGR